MTALNTRRILCVDNSPDDCELLQFVLDDAGYWVEIAHTVADGVRLAKRNPPDLCLLDVALIDGTGFDLLVKIRAFAPQTPVIICSADVRDVTQQRAKAEGAYFVAKPVDLEALTKTIAQLLWAG